MADETCLWQPSKERIQRSQMFEFMNRMAEQHGFNADWKSLHRWSVEHRDQFWRVMFDLARIEPTQEATAVYQGEGMLDTKWFPGMTLNFARHLLRYDDDRVAFEAEDERGCTRSITYRELNREVARLAAAMKKAGVVKGDRVAGFLPNIPETVMAMLAAASLGAIWSSCSPDFGINGVFDRFGQIEPKLLVAADGYSYNGKPIDSLARVKGILERIDSIERTIIVPFLNDEPDISAIPHAIRWHDFVATGENATSLTFEPVPFDHPLYIMYSSGTTGVPKCIVHGHGGTLIQHMKELMLHSDLRREDSIFYFTTCGWMMWNWLVSGLGVGATVVLYDGSPFHPRPNHLWKMTERLGITVFGTSPKFVAACENVGLKPKDSFDLSALRAMLSTGSPLTVENFKWVYENVKSDLQLSSICGGTDIISCFMLGNPVLPVYAGEIQCLGLGMDVAAFSDDGKRVIEDTGELVCCKPFPSQPVHFWNDPDGSKYRGAYFEHFPGVWRHGDFVKITERGGVVVFGRSDATLNPGGVRIGTAEIYRVVESFEEVLDSVVVGLETDDDDVDICLFVVLRDDKKLDDTMIDAIRGRIREQTTPRHVPKHVRQVSAVPYTISGKKVELAVSNMIHGRPVKNRDALANPDALEQYAGIV